jgi:hypothetical protein
MNDSTTTTDNSGTDISTPPQQQPALEFPGLNLPERLKLVHQYVAKAARNRNAHLGALAGMEADLLSVEAFLARTIERTMASDDPNLEEIERYVPALDMLVRLAKLISQLAQLTGALANQPKTRARRSKKPR